jgi:threonine dehydrogenase-like Zn-dependent dehydrogenase
MLGAERVIAIDEYEERLRRAEERGCRDDQFQIPLGSLINRALTIKTGQTPVHRYMQLLLDKVIAGEIDPSFVITHRMRLEQAPAGYELFKKKLRRLREGRAQGGVTSRSHVLGNG